MPAHNWREMADATREVLDKSGKFEVKVCEDAAILGGVRTLFGPVVGATVLSAIEEGSRTLFGGTGRGTDLIVYGLLIVGIAVFRPEGILGIVAARRPATPAPPASAEAPGP